jgi:SutA-like transcriptional regulator
VNKRPTKSDIRKELDSQVRDFLEHGGALEQVERGVSGRFDKNGPIKSTSMAFDEPKEGRTPVTDVIANIEARKHPEPVKKKAKPTRQKKKMIYDDFGEPLRWEWVEE